MKIGKIFSLFCLLSYAGLSQAAQYAVSLENDQLVAGDVVEVSLFLLKSEPGKMTSADFFPGEIICELVTDGKELTVPCEKVAGEKGSSRLVEEHYRFRLPGQLQGQVVLSFKALDAPRVVLDVGQAAEIPQGLEKEPGKQGQSDDIPDKVYPTLDEMFALYQPYEDNVSAYQPVYFLVGTDPENSKFQISFKYRFFNSDSLLAQSYPWLEGLYLGYTQTSFWDLASVSAPFDDTSYKPEFFWLSRNWLTTEHGLLKGLFLQSGLQHESNGKGGDDSRSTNFLYLKPTFIFYDENTEFGLQISSKVWSYIHNEETTNDGLPDYRGYFELETKFGWAENFVAGTHLRWADEGVSFRCDISYPLHNLFGNVLDVYLYAQYTNVLAESLIDYQDRTQSVRFGLGFIR